MKSYCLPLWKAGLNEEDVTSSSAAEHMDA